MNAIAPQVKVAAACFFLPLVGCHSLISCNLGVVNKVAASNNALIDPEVACAALAPFRFKSDADNKIAPDVEINWTRNCQRILTEQSKAKGVKP